MLLVETMGASRFTGWIDANPTLVGIVILVVVLIAVAYVASRLRPRPGGD